MGNAFVHKKAPIKVVTPEKAKEPKLLRRATGICSLSHEIGEVVSFLLTEELLELLSIFRKSSEIHARICQGFRGAIQWPLTRARCIHDEDEEDRVGKVENRHVLKDPSTGHDFVITFRRSRENIIVDFPQMEALEIAPQMGGIKDGRIHDILRNLRSALHFGLVKSLRVLTISVAVEVEDGWAFACDIPAVMRRGLLRTLELLDLSILRQVALDGDRFESIFDSRRGDTARALVVAMAKNCPLLRDFRVSCDADLVECVLSQHWPSLAVLRSSHTVRRGQVGAAAEAADPDHPVTLATALAAGRFPSLKTLIISEWLPSHHAFNLLSDLPPEGLPQISELVLIGRILKSPLLNFRVSGALTLQEKRHGGGGVILQHLFSNLKVLDISRLFCPPALSEDAYRADINDLGLVAIPHENYRTAFANNTVRAVQNLRNAVTGCTLQELVISDAFFSCEDWSTEANLQVGSATRSVMQALRPSKLTVGKWDYVNEPLLYRGMGVYVGEDGARERIACGARCTFSGFTGGGRDEDEDSGSLPFDDETYFACKNLLTILRDSHNLHGINTLRELVIDAAFLFSFKSLLTVLLETDDVLGSIRDDRFLDGRRHNLTLKETRELSEALEMFSCAGDRNENCYFDQISAAQIHQQTEWSCERMLQRLQHVSNFEAKNFPVFDFKAALSGFTNLKTLTVAFDNCSAECLDLEWLYSIVPAGCGQLFLRGAFVSCCKARFNKFERLIWQPFLRSRRDKIISDFFFPPDMSELGVGPAGSKKISVTVTSWCGMNKLSAIV